MSDLVRVPCVMMRGGTSKGPFFKASDIPSDPAARDAFLIAAMGSGNPVQIDGIGGGNPVTSKVAIVSRAKDGAVDIDYLFAQVIIDRHYVDTTPNCGNMLSGVGAFAIEEGLFPANDPETVVRIRNVNTGAIVEQTVQTPGGQVVYGGDQEIAGVPGTAAPVKMKFTEAAGAVTGKLLPSGNLIDVIDGVEVTLFDYAMPIMLVEAEKVGVRGDETPEELDANRDLFARTEELRLEAGKLMGMGDVAGRVVPKVALLKRAEQRGHIVGRYLVPYKTAPTFALTGSLCVAAAACTQGTVVARLMHDKVNGDARISIEHPSGQIDVEVEVNPDAEPTQALRGASVLRTTRRLFEGHVLVPRSVLSGTERVAAE